MIHKNMPRNCMVFLLSREETRLAILWSKNFDPWKMVDCVIFYFSKICLTIITNCFKPFKDQLVRSKKTCFFKATSQPILCHINNNVVGIMLVFVQQNIVWKSSISAFKSSSMKIGLWIYDVSCYSPLLAGMASYSALNLLKRWDDCVINFTRMELESEIQLKCDLVPQ